MASASVGVSEAAEVDTGRLEGASSRRVILVVLLIAASTEIVAFQVSFIALSARYIGVSFPSAGSQLPWLATLYALVGGVAVPVAGKVSDLVGKKRVIVACLLVSLAGSVLDATTHSWTVLLLGRGLQGLASPAIVVSYGLIRDLAPRRMVTMAIAVAGGGTGVGAILGPVAGGLLTDHYSWRSLFWFCTVYTAVTIIPLLLFVPETRLRVKTRLDLVGAALLGAGIALALIYLSRGSDWGWGRASSLAWLLSGLALLVGFYVWETRTPEPLMDPALLRSTRVLLVLAAAFLINLVLQGITFATGYIAETPGGAAGDAVKQQIVNGAAQSAAHQYGYPASLIKPFLSVRGDLPGFNLTLLQFSLKALLALSVVYVLVAPVVAWLSMRLGLQRPFIVCTLIFAVSALLLAPFHHSIVQLALLYLLLGLGVGIFFGAVPNMLIEAVPQEQQGISAGMYGAFGGFGAAAATSVAASIMAAHPLVLHVAAPGHVQDTPLNTGALAQLPQDTAYTDLFLILAAVATAAFVLSLFMRHFRHPATGGIRY